MVEAVVPLLHGLRIRRRRPGRHDGDHGFQFQHRARSRRQVVLEVTGGGHRNVALDREVVDSQILNCRCLVGAGGMQPDKGSVLGIRERLTPNRLVAGSAARSKRAWEKPSTTFIKPVAIGLTSKVSGARATRLPNGSISATAFWAPGVASFTC